MKNIRSLYVYMCIAIRKLKPFQCRQNKKCVNIYYAIQDNVASLLLDRKKRNKVVPTICNCRKKMMMYIRGAWRKKDFAFLILMCVFVVFSRRNAMHY